MTRRFTTTIDIAAAPSRVWAVMSDIERWHEWTASIRSVIRTNDGPMGVGSTALVKQPKLAPANFVVTTWEPNRGFDWTTRNPVVSAVGHHWIEPDPQGSRVTLGVVFNGPLAGLVGWLYGGLTRRYIGMEAAGLKRRVEEREPTR